MSGSFHDYAAYGLHVRSAVVIPFARPWDAPADDPDVVVRLGRTPAALPGAIGRKPGLWENAAGVFLQRIDGVARYLVTNGRDVLVEPRGGDESAIGAFLSTSIFGAVLQQRGVMAFHAGSVVADGGAVLLLGCSGIGKSSLAAALHNRGCDLLADDVTGVVLDRGAPPRRRRGLLALPSLPCFRLRPDMLDATCRVGARDHVRPGIDKYVAPATRFHAAPAPVRAACVLTIHNRPDVRIEPAPPAGAFKWLSRYTYRKLLLHGHGQQMTHFRVLTAMARSVPLVRVTRPAVPRRLDLLANRIIDWVAEHARAGGAQEPSAG